jgi:hypothetical protein
MICPRCQHHYDEHATGTVPGVCPGCGIAIAKWLDAQQAALEVGAVAPAAVVSGAVARDPWWLRLYHYACFMPSDRHESAFWGHTVIWVCFLFWGWRFILHGIDWRFTGTSFLHSVNLPFHEYGHVMFSPFGTFWMFLGGSLFQIVLPLLPLAAFMVLQRDNFAASIMLWWSGQNLLDVAPYIADAPLRAIPLINGNDATHDWWNLLTMSDALEQAPVYANVCFTLGVLVILLSNVWGGYLLWVEFQGRTRPATP